MVSRQQCRQILGAVGHDTEVKKRANLATPVDLVALSEDDYIGRSLIFRHSEIGFYLLALPRQDRIVYHRVKLSSSRSTTDTSQALLAFVFSSSW